MEDEPTPLSPNGAFAGQRRPNALLLDRPSGLLTPVYEAVFAPKLLTLLYQLGLFALNICTAAPSVEACTPLAAKFGRPCWVARCITIEDCDTSCQ
jgi:hypothetical protein